MVDRVNLPVGLFPGAGIAPTPQERAAAERQAFLDYRADLRSKRNDEREASSNRIRNGIFDFMTDKVGATPEWAGRAADISDLIPLLGDVSTLEDSNQAFRSGSIGTGLALGGLGIAGLLPMSDFATKPAGKALREAARSGDPVAAVFKGLNDLPTTRAEHLADMTRGKAAQGPWGAAVDVRATPDDYAGERMFRTNAGSRFSVSPTGEINSVVKQVDDPNAGLAGEALSMARNHGGGWLSVFDTKVAERYANAGFRPVKRMKFADEYAPPGWDYDAFKDYNGGRPDVVFMEYDPNYKGGYKAGESKVGAYTDDYDGTAAELAARNAQRNDPREIAKRVLQRRSEIMDLPVKDRPQADPELLQMGSNPKGYARGLPEQTPVATPPRRPKGKNPAGNRIDPIIERQEEIAAKLAERAEPFLGGPAQYFYHTGPIVEAAERAGMPPEEARALWNKFADYYAATSPRTPTEQNLRNASLARWKHEQGIPLTDTVGPGTVTETGEKAVGEHGYPMMLGEGSIHALRLGELEGGGTGPSMLTNTKPFTFAENVKGNLEGATVDTHAIRGMLSALNEIEPGSVPEGWLRKEFRDQYKADPSSFDPALWVDDKLKQVPTPEGKAQVEYGPISDLYKAAGKKLGVSPAEMQSLGWFGSGAETGLASDLKTVSELFDERIAVTAKEMGMEPEEVLVKSLRGQMPLLGLGGLSILPFLNQMGTGDERKSKGKT